MRSWRIPETKQQNASRLLQLPLPAQPRAKRQVGMATLRRNVTLLRTSQPQQLAATTQVESTQHTTRKNEAGRVQLCTSPQPRKVEK